MESASDRIGVLVHGRADDRIVLSRAADLGEESNRDVLVVLRRPFVFKVALLYASLDPDTAIRELEMTRRQVVREVLVFSNERRSYSVSTASWPATVKGIGLAAREGCSVLIVRRSGWCPAEPLYRYLGSRLGLDVRIVAG